jgi:hypothetical protein
MDGKFDRGVLFVSRRSTAACHKAIRVDRLRAVINAYLLTAPTDTAADADVCAASKSRYDYCLGTLEELSGVLRQSELAVGDVLALKPTLATRMQAAYETVVSPMTRLVGRLWLPRVNYSDVAMVALVAVGLYCYVDTLLRSMRAVTGEGAPEGAPSAGFDFLYFGPGGNASCSCKYISATGDALDLIADVNPDHADPGAERAWTGRAVDDGAPVALGPHLLVFLLWPFSMVYSIFDSCIWVMVYVVTSITWLVYRVFCLYLALLLITKVPGWINARRRQRPGAQVVR